MADNFASSEIEDVSYAIMDVQSQIVQAASVLAARSRMTSMEAYLLPREGLSSLNPNNQLRLLQNHLRRLRETLDAHPGPARLHRTNAELGTKAHGGTAMSSPHPLPDARTPMSALDSPPDHDAGTAIPAPSLMSAFDPAIPRMPP